MSTRLTEKQLARMEEIHSWSVDSVIGNENGTALFAEIRALRAERDLLHEALGIAIETVEICLSGRAPQQSIRANLKDLKVVFDPTTPKET